MAHVAAAKLEAIPASEYARRHGLSVKSLYYWRRKLKKFDKADAPLPAGKFIALRITPGAAQQSNCTLVLPSDLRLEMSVLPAPGWLAALVCAVPGIR
ncbi:MAG: hypothetical protein A2503_19065 [Burkholderiales bacterium RIFOXYD12_FULL_59_19]|nr:MAG: hypothetical protein A2503_19065 [Burkholderiales bacterium RIFOXYD12_FULL_59_19]